MTTESKAAAFKSSSSVVPAALARALTALIEIDAARVNLIPWGSPIPVFGDPSSSRVATMGINPSSREFLGTTGDELDGNARRFHTLTSLDLERWDDTDADDLAVMTKAALSYFTRNPYDTWFRPLDRVIAGSGFSFYDAPDSACHLDLVPFATASRWGALTHGAQRYLLDSTHHVVANLLRDSAVEVLVLNGRTVVSCVERLVGANLARRRVRGWSLHRRAGSDVPGVAFSAVVSSFAGVSLDRDLLVIGFNHNLQSSYGVTSKVSASIRSWLAKTIGDWTERASA